jgi:hypothetical protein
VRVSSKGHAQPVSQWWWWSDVDRRVGCSGWWWWCLGPGQIQTTVNSGCRVRESNTNAGTVQNCHEKRVSGGRRQRSGEQVGRAVYLSETRSDVRSSGARSRLREWLGRAGSVKMCSRREEDTNEREVGASEWRRRGYLRKTDDKTNKRVYQFN